MPGLMDACRAGRLNGRDAENPYIRSSSSARAYTAGVLLGQRGGTVPTGCKPGRGHTLCVQAGAVGYLFNFAESETSPTVDVDGQQHE